MGLKKWKPGCFHKRNQIPGSDAYLGKKRRSSRFYICRLLSCEKNISWQDDCRKKDFSGFFPGTAVHRPNDHEPVSSSGHSHLCNFLEFGITLYSPEELLLLFEDEWRISGAGHRACLYGKEIPAAGPADSAAVQSNHDMRIILRSYPSHPLPSPKWFLPDKKVATILWMAVLFAAVTAISVVVWAVSR